MRAFFSCVAWRAIPSPLSKLKRRLDFLEATQCVQEIRVATQEESGVLCFPSIRGLIHRVRLECDPDIPVAPGEELYVQDTSLDEDSLPCSDTIPTPSSPWQVEWKIALPGPTQKEVCIPHRNSRIPMQLEKNHVVPSSSKCEALARYSVSREVPRSVLKRETVFCTLDATPKLPRHTGLTRGEHRCSRHHFI